MFLPGFLSRFSAMHACPIPARLFLPQEEYDRKMDDRKIEEGK